VAFLAITSVYSSCAAAATDHSLIAQFNILNGGTTTIQATTSAAGAAGACAATGTALLCCVDAEVRKVVKIETDRVKAQYEGFGAAAYRIGEKMSKIALIATAAGNTTLEGVTASGELSGASTTQLKAFTYYPAATFDADYTAFKAQVVGCYEYHAAAVQKVACHACMETTSNMAPWTTTTTIPLKEASCSEWATKCNRVWAFLHKASWLIQTVALLNKKQEKTAGSVTFPTLTTPWGYAPGYTNIADINTAIEKCGGAAITTTDVATCTQVHRGDLCKNFIGMFAGTAAAAGVLLGRSQTTFIDGTYVATSTQARRMLAIGTNTGAVAIDAAGVDTTSGNALVFPPTTAVTTITVPATWSSGYVAPTTPGGSSAAGGNKSSTAKVVIGTILSALFAIALLN
jgi:hypothetical protein